MTARIGCAEDPELWARLDEAIDAFEAAQELFVVTLKRVEVQSLTARSERDAAAKELAVCARALLEAHDAAQVAGSEPA